MTPKTEIKAVEMVRRIRDAHAEQVRGMSREERIAFYNAAVVDRTPKTLCRRKPERAA